MNGGLTQLFYSHFITLLCHIGSLRRREKFVHIPYVVLSVCSHVHAQSMLHFYILFLHIFLKNSFRILSFIYQKLMPAVFVLFTESQNHRMVGVGRDLCGS